MPSCLAKKYVSTEYIKRILMYFCSALSCRNTLCGVTTMHENSYNLYHSDGADLHITCWSVFIVSKCDKKSGWRSMEMYGCLFPTYRLLNASQCPVISTVHNYRLLWVMWEYWSRTRWNAVNEVIGTIALYFMIVYQVVWYQYPALVVYVSYAHYGRILSVV